MQPINFTQRLQSLIDARDDNAQKLPRSLRPYLNAIFGTKFDEVRIHIGQQASMLGAKAFALGNDLFFSENEYNTSTEKGLSLLGHELAHIVQQRSGRVPSVAQLSVVTDESLELEADNAGFALAHAVAKSELPSKALFDSVFNPNVERFNTIQCLISWDKFKQDSSAMGRRNRIVRVDDALKNYHLAVAEKPKAWTKIKARLDTVIAECNSYNIAKPTSNRKPAVDKLLKESAAEQAIFGPILACVNHADDGDKWDAIEEANETYLAFRHHLTPKEQGVININDLISVLLLPLADQMKNPVSGSKIVNDDIQELKRIAQSAETPEVLKMVINEVTDAKNMQQLDLSFNSPSAKYNVSRGMHRKYTLNHMLNQSEGRKFRLGSLLHELTHISIAETYGNSIIMLACHEDLSDEEMMGIVNVRKAKILNLISLVDEAPLLNPGVASSGNGLTQVQKKELKAKLNYVLDSNQAQKYLGLLSGITHAKTVGQSVKNKQVSIGERVKTLLAKGMCCELTEYDTVINQTTMWCHLWRLAPDNAVFASLKTNAQLAYNGRMSARGRRKLIKSPVSNITMHRHGRRNSVG